MDIKCSREGFKCDGCPIMDKCEHIAATEEINPYVLYEQGRADAIEKCIEVIEEDCIDGCEKDIDCLKCTLEKIEQLKNTNK